MAELTKKERSAAAKKAAKTRKENEAKVSKPKVLDDLSTQADDMASMGHFVDVVSGPHKGVYGVLVEDAEGDDVVVRTRDSDSGRIVVAYADLRPADPGKR